MEYIQTNRELKKHYGYLVEKTIRRNGYCITDLAKLMQVTRRCFYNWFQQENLKKEIILRIGCAMRHDFSEECSELFTEEEINRMRTKVVEAQTFNHSEETEKDSSYWKNKYLETLEAYTKLLIKYQESFYSHK